MNIIATLDTGDDLVFSVTIPLPKGYDYELQLKGVVGIKWEWRKRCRKRT